MYEKFGLFIDGKWTAASDGNTADVLSPVTENTLGAVPVATVADTRRALDAAN